MGHLDYEIREVSAEEKEKKIYDDWSGRVRYIDLTWLNIQRSTDNHKIK